MSNNDFEGYRRGKQRHGGRLDEAQSRFGWILIGVLLLVNAGAWTVAVPGYQRMVTEGGNPDSVETETPEAPERSENTTLQPGTILTERERDELAVAFLDVGQGDAIFIRTPSGKNVLVDSGEGSNPDFKFARSVGSAQNLILPFFRRNKIERLDYFVASHPHSDHIGSSYEIIRNTPVEDVWAAGYDHPSRSKKDMLNAIESKQSSSDIELHVPEGAGGTLTPGQKLDLGPATKGWLLRTNPDAENPNAASLVLLIVYGETGFLLTGDTEKHGERELIREWGEQLDVDVLKVGHHGSTSSSIPPFVETVQPDHSVIMVGHYNTFGHPNDSIMSRLKRAGSQIHRTDEDGTIFVFSDGRSVELETRPTVSAVNE